VRVLTPGLGIWYALMTGAESTLFAELFDADVRYTGMSLVFQFSGIWASGLTSVILTALVALGGGALWWAGGYLVLTALISLVAVATMPRFIGSRPAWAADARW
jgi:hypothetical protein